MNLSVMFVMSNSCFMIVIQNHLYIVTLAFSFIFFYDLEFMQ